MIVVDPGPEAVDPGSVQNIWSIGLLISPAPRPD